MDHQSRRIDVSRRETRDKGIREGVGKDLSRVRRKFSPRPHEGMERKRQGEKRGKGGREGGRGGERGG